MVKKSAPCHVNSASVSICVYSYLVIILLCSATLLGGNSLAGPESQRVWISGRYCVDHSHHLLEMLWVRAHTCNLEFFESLTVRQDEAGSV
jgi:hypothetical protein